MVFPMVMQEPLEIGQHMREDDMTSLLSLKKQARLVLREGNHPRFEQLLRDAVALDASPGELVAALLYVINTQGDVAPMERFLEREYDERCDDEHAATRVLAHSICSPEFPEAIHAHPEWERFLL
jgi:hypothetical protein